MGLLDIDPGLIIWTIVTFVVLLFVLRAVAWKPILAMIDEREESIQSSLEEAEQARQEAEETLKEYEQKLDEARKEGREIIAESKESAEKIKSEIVSEAEKQKRQMVEQARKEIDAEREKAIQDIKSSVADIAIAAASKIINKQLSVEAHKEIIEQSLQQFKGKQN